MDYLDTIIGNIWARQQREEQSTSINDLVRTDTVMMSEPEPFYVDDEYTDKDLHDNIMNGNVDFIVKYISDDGNPNRILMNQFSLLMTAVYFNNISIVRLLLKHKVNLENEQSEGDTALSYAAKFGKVSINILELLLKNGANPNHFSEIAASRRGNAHTPLSNCIRNSMQDDYINKLKLLLEYGANPNKKDAYGVNALHDAINILDSPELSETIKILIMYGADIDSVDGGGDGVLFRARLNNYPDALVTLLELGADPYIKNNDGFNVLKDSYFERDHKKILNKTINNLHKTNVALQTTASMRGISDRNSVLQHLREPELMENIHEHLKSLPLNLDVRNRMISENSKQHISKGSNRSKKGGKRSKKRSKRNKRSKRTSKK